jgi:hypothetical protein
MTKSHLEETFAYQIKVLGLPEPEREYKFHPKRKWRFDFAWLLDMVAVEIEGGTWTHGRHTRPWGFENDCIKYNTAQRMGWIVYRFTKRMVESGEAINFIEEALK